LRHCLNGVLRIPIAEPPVGGHVHSSRKRRTD
jgi:hypothetical protein